MSLETFVLDIMDGKRPGRSFLKGLSYLYRTAVALRNFAYDQRLVKTSKAAVPVVSIGNIVAGGTGKTPLVRFLSEALAPEMRVAILSRGYRSEIEKSNTVMKVTPEESAKKCGDEPFWLSQAVPQAAVWVGKNRSLSAELAVEAGAQVIVLDDGMQYRKLQRDFEIIVMDGDDLFGKGFFLPRGMLRDTPSRLKNADLIVVNQAKNHQQAKETVAKYTEAPVVFVRMKSNADFKGKKVGVFCAIGRPGRFMQAVRSCGGDVVATCFKADHDPFSPEELNNFAKRSGAELLVCTEKDLVKLPSDLQCGLPIYALEGEMEVVGGKDHWNAMIENIKLKVAHHDRRI
jgi:tetraacyldisaccharide 4'-kinase